MIVNDVCIMSFVIIYQRQYGVAALMENLETLGVQVATVLPLTDKYTGCSRMFRKNRLGKMNTLHINLVFCV